MRFLLGNGMYLTMVTMPMLSRPLVTDCGGTGDSIIHGDGVHLGITAVGIMVVGTLIITTTIIIGIRFIIIPIIRIMQA